MIQSKVFWIWAIIMETVMSLIQTGISLLYELFGEEVKSFTRQKIEEFFQFLREKVIEWIHWWKRPQKKGNKALEVLERHHPRKMPTLLNIYNQSKSSKESLFGFRKYSRRDSAWLCPWWSCWCWCGCYWWSTSLDGRRSSGLDVREEVWVNGATLL